MRLGFRPKALSCREMVDLVTAYIENALPSRERARFEEHIAGCDNCRAYLQEMRATIRLTGTLTEEQISPDAKSRLLDTFRAWKADT